ncbi:MAG: DNA repair protein RecN [SAR324 cluster bacterium]|uniref:DNA repair protein RecN n=1 Tax=SAR324 cluster bacterium TaxID=2024889 RepID=A0A7X9FSL3_9DELT|nr:DNA repair protein RecN [SAR324 cluster bacterium]
MLRELYIKNFAIIEEQCISFAPGLNVISGETGSGKSIILGALDLALGGKAKSSLIRSGEESLEVSAVLDLSGMPEALLKELPEIAQTDELAVARTLNLNGKGKIYINGKLASLAMLSEIMGKLVNICGQNQHVRLLDPKYHLELVDGFAANEKLLFRYQDLYRAFRKLEKLLSNFEEQKQKKEQRRELLEVIVSDLSTLDLFPGVREQLDTDVKRLANAEKLLMAAQSITQLFEEDSGIFSTLRKIGFQLSELRKLDENSATFQELFEAGKMNLEEFERELKRYVAGIELNEELLTQKREMLAQIASLERKYRTNDAGLVDLLERSKDELEDLSGVSNETELLVERDRIYNELSTVAGELSALRKSAGERIAKQVTKELGELNMKGASLEVFLMPEPLGINGLDRIEFRISTNKGEPKKALREIASGGELSRILLVLKKILRDRSGVNVLVFDEVDSGVSGSVARAVGEKLQMLAEYSQVICITHLAQIASLADHHLLVQKEIGKRAKSMIRELNSQERVEEIARMLAGHTITNASRDSARELLAGRGQSSGK